MHPSKIKTKAQETLKSPAYYRSWHKSKRWSANTRGPPPLPFKHSVTSRKQLNSFRPARAAADVFGVYFEKILLSSSNYRGVSGGASPRSLFCLRANGEGGGEGEKRALGGGGEGGAIGRLNKGPRAV